MKTRILATALCLLAIVAAVPCVAADNSDAKVPVCTKGACLAEEDELGLIGGGISSAFLTGSSMTRRLAWRRCAS